MASSISLDDMKKACDILYQDPYVVQTPILCNVQKMFLFLDQSLQLFLKLENMQTTGSFKIRGVRNQMEHLDKEVLDGRKHLVTLSAGNYGKAFAFCLSKLGLKGLVLMPHTAPDDRVKMIQSFGIDAIKVPSHELQKHIDSYIDSFL